MSARLDPVQDPAAAHRRRERPVDTSAPFTIVAFIPFLLFVSLAGLVVWLVWIVLRRNRRNGG